MPANEFRLRKLGLAQGLESLHMPGLQSLAIGPDGKLWCGTERGLYVFNGCTFRPYRPIDPTGAPLTQILITALITDAEGSLWAGTYERGLYRIRPDGTVQHFTELADSTGLGDDRILCLGLCPRGILVGLHERGVQLLDPSTQKFSLYVPQPQFVRADDLRHLVNSPQHVAPDVADPNIIWQATGSGLVRLDLRTGQNETFHPDPLGPQNSVFGIRHFVQVDGGHLILATWGKGLSRFNPSTKEFLKIDLSDDDFWVNNIKHIEPLPDGRWLLAQGGAGLSVFDPRTSQLEWIDRQIRPFFMLKDPVGDLWVATLGQGVVAVHQGYQHLRPLPFERVVDLKPFGNGNLILTDGPPMLTITDRDYRTMRSLSLNPKVELEYPQQVLAGGSDTAMVLFHKGLMMVNMATGQVTDLNANLKGLHNPDRAGLIAMARSADGELWIGSTWNGIIRLDRNMRPVRSYGGEKGNSTGNDLTYIGWVTDMATDANGNAWYATLRGHGYFDRGKQQFVNFQFVPGNDGTLGFKRINALCPTADSMLVASAEAGLAIRGLQEGGSLIGLRDARWAKAGVSDVAVGADGSLWAITPSGIIIRRENEKPLRFGPAHGLRGNEKLMVDANGQVLILQGGKLLIPRHLGPATGLSMPAPRIVGLKVNGVERPINQSLIELQPDENALELRYALSILTGEVGGITEFSLNGTTWTATNGDGVLQLSELAPGRYRIAIRHTDPDGVVAVSDPIEIRILNPLLLRWWAVLIWASLTVAAGYALYRHRLATLMRRQKEKDEVALRLAQLEMDVLRAQMNPHFIFNCLNSIKLLIKQGNTTEADRYLTLFSRLLRAVLENSTQRTVTLAQDLAALRLYLEMEQLRFKDRMAFDIQVDGQIDADALQVQPLLIQPFVENAIWHGLMPLKDRQGKVEVDVHLEGSHHLKVTITDNGVGRPSSNNAESASNTYRSFGSGLSARRVELGGRASGQEAMVEIADLKDNSGHPLGTRVVLGLPMLPSA